ncbi:MAG: hypothetical protein ACFCVC_13660 [Acidimicrobiia bacterium]
MAIPLELSARLELVGVTDGPFPVIVGIGSGRLGIRTELMDIGGWDVVELDISLDDEAVTIDVEGERLLLSFDRPADGRSALIRELEHAPV